MDLAVNGRAGRVHGTTVMIAAVAGFTGVARVGLLMPKEAAKQDVTRIVFPCCMVEWVTQVRSFLKGRRYSTYVVVYPKTI